MNLSNSVLGQVIDQDTAFKMWTKLNELYESKDLPSKMFLRERFFTFKMNQSKTLAENLDEFKNITAGLETQGENIGVDNEALCTT